MKKFYTAEAVTEGHPDKVCDQIADAILDVCLKQDEQSRVACEVLATKGTIIVAGEITSAYEPEVFAVVRKVLSDVGYCSEGVAMDTFVHQQSPDIANAVRESKEKREGVSDNQMDWFQGAEDQGVMIGYVSDLLSEKGISLDVDIPDKLLCEVDPAQMERAIQNVLVNAIRYSPNGEMICISLSNEKNTVYCEIENTGVHIPEDMVSHLFEAFYRADTSRNRNTGGTGLGLYIVRKIMELHHAKYGIKNSSSGVKFWFEISQKRNVISSI